MKFVLLLFFLVSATAIARECPLPPSTSLVQPASPTITAHPGAEIVIEGSCIRGGSSISGDLLIFSASIVGSGVYEGQKLEQWNAFYFTIIQTADLSGDNNFQGYYWIEGNVRDVTVDTQLGCILQWCDAVYIGRNAQVGEGVVLKGSVGIHGTVGAGITIEGYPLDPAYQCGITIDETSSLLGNPLLSGCISIGNGSVVTDATLEGLASNASIQISASSVTGGSIRGYGIVWVSNLSGGAIESLGFSINRFNGPLSFTANNVTLCDEVTGTIEAGYNNCFKKIEYPRFTMKYPLEFARGVK